MIFDYISVNLCGIPLKEKGTYFLKLNLLKLEFKILIEL